MAASQKHLVEIATQNLHQSSMTPIAAHKLQYGQHYCWRVQAYGKGRVIGQSKARGFTWKASKPKLSIDTNIKDTNTPVSAIPAIAEGSTNPKKGCHPITGGH